MIDAMRMPIDEASVRAEIHSLEKIRRDRFIANTKRSTESLKKLTALVNEQWLALPEDIQITILQTHSILTDVLEQPAPELTLQQHTRLFFQLLSEVFSSDRPFLAFALAFEKFSKALYRIELREQSLWKFIDDERLTDSAKAELEEARQELDSTDGVTYTGEAFKSRFLSA